MSRRWHCYPQYSILPVVPPGTRNEIKIDVWRQFPPQLQFNILPVGYRVLIHIALLYPGVRVCLVDGHDGRWLWRWLWLDDLQRWRLLQLLQFPAKGHHVIARPAPAQQDRNEQPLAAVFFIPA